MRTSSPFVRLLLPAALPLTLCLSAALASEPPPRDGPPVITDDPSGRIRVDTPDGPVWIERTRRGAEGTAPYPGCLVCHGDIESAAVNMGLPDLDCTLCHGGDPLATTLPEAHVASTGQVPYDKTIPPLDQGLAYQRFINPSNLRVAGLSCGFCHPTIFAEIGKSMMALR